MRETGRKRSSESKTGYRYRCRAFSVRTLKQIRAKISAKWITMKTVDFIGGERKEEQESEREIEGGEGGKGGERG